MVEAVRAWQALMKTKASTNLYHSLKLGHNLKKISDNLENGAEMLNLPIRSFLIDR